MSEQLIDKYKPKSLGEMILNPKTRESLEKLALNNLSFILYGPEGCGKGTFVDILIADINDTNLMWIEAARQNIDWIRDNVERYSATTTLYDSHKYIVFNECDKLSIDAQALLKGIIERYKDWNRFVFMTNNFDKMDTAISNSRLVPVEFRNPPKGDVLKYFKNILVKEGSELNHQTEQIIKTHLSDGHTDFRGILNKFENLIYK